MPRRPLQWNGDIIPFKPSSPPKPGAVERLIEPYLNLLFLSSEKLRDAEVAAGLLHIETGEDEDGDIAETLNCQGYYCEILHTLELAEVAVESLMAGQTRRGTFALQGLAADLEHHLIPFIDTDNVPLPAKRNGKRAAKECLDILHKMLDTLGIIDNMTSAEVVPLL